MRSAVFSAAGEISDKLRDDLRTVATLPAAIKKDLPRYSGRFLLTRTDREEVSVQQEFVSESGLAWDEAARALRVVLFFLKQMRPNDSAADIIDDIRELDVVEEPEALKPLFESLVAYYNDEFNRPIQARRAFAATVPYLRSTAYSVELRGVFEREYEDDIESPDKYKPNLTGLLPVAVVRLKTNPDQSFVFQVRPGTLKTLINELTALERKLNTLVEDYGETEVAEERAK